MNDQDFLADAIADWEADILPTLQEYIAIPAVSESYDAAWAAHGHLAKAVELIRSWCASRPVKGLTVEVQEIEGRTPLIVMEVPASDPANTDTVLLYGHLDKQPEMEGWREGLGPWIPVIEGDRLYGRGGADDGYSAFASVLAIELAQRHGLPHARCIVLIEASEESGSPDLPAHLAALGDRLGTPTLVVCLDSACMDYDRLWVTTSLRGLVDGVLRVEVLTEGVHSGEASGVVASSFRIARELLQRIEDVDTGRVRVPEMHVEIPANRVAEAAKTASELPEPIAEHFPFVEGMQPVVTDPAEQLLARTWHPALSVTGADGWPPTNRAGNVLRPYTALRLSFRIPPGADPDAASAAVKAILEADPPYGAHVTYTPGGNGPGWNAPPFAPWLQDGLEAASTATFGQPSRAFGEGGTIPFMGMLGQQFPDAQFVITGALGPGSNAHGPNEYLHLPTAKKVTAVIALLLAAHTRRS
jgi:acetylornithine deacetylase/succinyl-diaminopimelate desuccinylase-like protein